MWLSSHCLPHARHMPSFKIRLWMLLFSSVVGSTASTSLSGQTPSRSISSKRLVPSPLNCLFSLFNCDDLALYRRISLYRRFLSSGFILSTSAAIILPWYTMDLKNLEAFLPGPRQASERGVCPLAGSKWGSAFDTVFSVWRLHVRSKCIFWHIIYTCWLQRDTVLLHLLPQMPHDLRAVSLFFFREPIAREYTEQYKCLAMRCLLSYYDILYLLHIIIHGLLCGTESMWIQVSKSI